MILQLHDKLQKPLVLRATRLLVTFEDGTPVALIHEVVKGHVQVFRAGDPDFNDRLRLAGIDQTVIVDKLKDVQPAAQPNRLIY
jgi:hypothetical protein